MLWAEFFNEYMSIHGFRDASQNANTIGLLRFLIIDIMGQEFPLGKHDPNRMA